MMKNGFTLLEVLIALVILALSLTAIISALIQHGNTLEHLRNKTTAHWVAMNVINRYEIQHNYHPTATSATSGQETALNKTWRWSLVTNTTADPSVLELQVTVSSVENNKVFATLWGYTHAP